MESSAEIKGVSPELYLKKSQLLLGLKINNVIYLNCG